MLNKDTISQSMNTRMSSLRNKKNKDNILIHEIYSSIQGESSYMGKPCVFIRTTGCHLRCRYCDTAHAFFDGREQSIDYILQEVSKFNIKLVELTGGEPLLQKSCFTLLDRLVKENYCVLLETSGAVSIKNVNKKVKIILDVKTPSSGQVSYNTYKNLDNLWVGCEIKFVLGNINDYKFALKICQDYSLFHRFEVLFSPIVQMIDPKIIAEKIVADKLPVRFQMQLHRVLYGEEKGK